ncbi:nuclease-related domain-containing protein [Domibacillus indicus]|uniref:nuclease-related domain-containing protein n=1 Tax=Domibacillus indicus TaxID=1437523 RepID=UPI000617CF2D|nr:nuclease-related domain-containing protein [Domibacillus indicus]
MGQLIKLQNYISRYENDVFHYPAQYVRLKKQEWEKFYANWEGYHQNAGSISKEPDEQENWLLEEEPKEKQSLFRGLFSKKEKQAETEPDPVALEEEENLFSINHTESLYLKTEEDVKKAFLDKMFTFQIKWASSTLLHQSPLDHKYYVDEQLRFLLKRLPDTFLILYEPVFRFQKAVVELDVIIITPLHVWCLTFLEEQDEAVFIGSPERFWEKRFGEAESKVLSPAVPLARAETIVKKLLGRDQIDMPVRKAVVSRNGYIDDPAAPADIHYIDKREFSRWFDEMRHLSSPLKTIQLKAARTLLAHADTVSIRRPEWEEEL